MNPARDYKREVEHLQKRLTRLGKAFLRINESLDYTAVLRGVLDSARSLTDARYGMMTLLEAEGRVRQCLVSGLSPDHGEGRYSEPENDVLLEHFNSIVEPLRSQDINSDVRRLGLPEFRPPMPPGPGLTFLAAPVRYRDERVGTCMLFEKDGGAAFTAEDEEALMMFASQAALAITNARRYGEEERAKADLEALIKTSPVSVLVFNARTGEIISSNRESVRLMHVLRIECRTLEDILNQVRVRYADGRELSSAALSVSKLLSSAETLRAEEVIIEGPDGDRVTALLNVTPIRSDDGGVASLIVTSQDMTHLEELERQRSDFLAIVSHELRAPLAAIKGSAATVLGDSLALGKSEMLQFFRIINQHADQMNGLVNDLLDVARIRTGTLQVNSEPLPVTRLVDRARSMFDSGGGRKNVRIELDPELPPVNADGRRISQVMVNLLSNADQNSPEHSPLRISASLDGAHVAFCVEDKGRGISAQRLPHIFRKIARHDGEEGPARMKDRDGACPSARGS
ncbi:MAG: GAF domain-containing protein [Gemmatimonadota bacterium]|nr:GAF domain-containing protein [Gemmatimonadota bacterium]